MSKIISDEDIAKELDDLTEKIAEIKHQRDNILRLADAALKKVREALEPVTKRLYEIIDMYPTDRNSN